MMTKWELARNENTRKTIHQPPVLEKIKRKQIGWYEYITKMGNPIKGRRGRSRRNLLDQIEDIGRSRDKS